jgi:hypothetical protein
VLLTVHDDPPLEPEEVENILRAQLISGVFEMVVVTAEVTVGHRSVQLAVSVHTVLPVDLLQALVQQQSSAMLWAIEPDRSRTSSTSTGALLALDVFTPQLASAVGVEPPPFPPPPLVLASGSWTEVAEPAPPPPLFPVPVLSPEPPIESGELLLQLTKANPKNNEAVTPIRLFARTNCFMASPASLRV